MQIKQHNGNIFFELNIDNQINRDDTSKDPLDCLVWELFGYNPPKIDVQLISSEITKNKNTQEEKL